MKAPALVLMTPLLAQNARPLRPCCGGSSQSSRSECVCVRTQGCARVLTAVHTGRPSSFSHILDSLGMPGSHLYKRSKASRSYREIQARCLHTPQLQPQRLQLMKYRPLHLPWPAAAPRRSSSTRVAPLQHRFQRFAPRSCPPPPSNTTIPLALTSGFQGSVARAGPLRVESSVTPPSYRSISR